jgi:hypothetical protein|tara:strand:- start:331 stop:936 length:606 start_codon:yes stop_codon:yes gene_type:complete
VIDPLFVQVIAMGFALIFALAALHKMDDRNRFLSILKAYKILPRFMLRASALCIPMLELMLALGWLQAGLLGSRYPVIVVASAGLLIVYGLAIAINLLRGRTDIDCGCNLISARKSAPADKGSESQQSISTNLIWRNVCLALLTLTALTPITARQLGVIDYIGLAGALLVLVLLYASLTQLMATNQIIRSWRGHLGRLAND